jgi:hypothetical protein
MEKVEFHIPFKIQQTLEFSGFQDENATFSLDSITYEGMGLEFNH